MFKGLCCECKRKLSGQMICYVFFFGEHESDG